MNKGEFDEGNFDESDRTCIKESDDLSGLFENTEEVTYDDDNEVWNFEFSDEDILLDFTFDVEDEQCKEEDSVLPDKDTIINGAINSLIKLMSTNKDGIQNETDDIIKEITNYYQTDYRHSYFSIFQIICEISKTPDDLLILTMNMDTLKEQLNYRYDKKNRIILKFKKLYDYVMLEAVRVYTQVENVEKINRASEIYNDISSDLLNQKDSIAEFTTKLQDAKDGYINQLLTVLGVFSGVIIAFFGGLQYISSAFNQINAISKYRLVFITLLVGFVVFNSIAVMMIFMAKMTGKEIYEKCKTTDCSCEKKCTFLGRIKNKLSFVYYVNTVLIIFMVTVTFLWVMSNYLVFPIR